MLDHEVLEVCDASGQVRRQTFPRDDAERLALEHFARAVRGAGVFPVTLPQVLNGIAAVEAFVESTQRNGELVALPPGD